MQSVLTLILTTSLIFEPFLEIFVVGESIPSIPKQDLLTSSDTLMNLSRELDFGPIYKTKGGKKTRRRRKKKKRTRRRRRK